jgi:hypothetical protein
MFSEWTDPHDIDNYYDDLEHLLEDVQAAPSSSVYYQLPRQQLVVATPEVPTQPIIMQPAGAPETAPPVKSTFLPFPGLQVEQSKSEHMTNQTGEVCKGYTLSLIPDNWWIYAAIFIMFLFLVGMLLHQRSQLNAAQMTLRMLIAMYSQSRQPSSISST